MLAGGKVLAHYKLALAKMPQIVVMEETYLAESATIERLH